MRDQDHLRRVTKGPDDQLLVGRNLPGRGAWICSGSKICLDHALKRRAFGRALRGTFGTGATEGLRRQLFPDEPEHGSGDLSQRDL